MAIQSILAGFIGLVIVLVITISGLFPVIGDAITNATGTGGWATNFTGTAALLKIIPLTLVAALILLVIATAFV